MDIRLTRLEAQTLIQAAEFALESDAKGSIFYDDHRTAVRRSIRKIERYIGENPNLDD